MKWKTINALEASLGATPLRVDRGQGIIYGVKVIGFDSDNGRKYLPEALKAARKLYEGVKVNIDHPTDDPADTRSAYDRFGKLQNIRFISGQGLFADLVYLKSHPMAGRVTEAAERMPEAFGLSHNAQGEGEKDGDTFVVHRVTEVRHVDLVADPATTKSLSEGTMAKRSKRKLWEDEEKKSIENDDEKKTAEDEDEKKDDSLAAKVLDALKEADQSDEEKAQAIVDLVKEALEEAGEDTPEAEDAKEDEEKTEEDDEVKEEDTEGGEDAKEDEEKTKEEDEVKEGRRFSSNPALRQLQEEIRRMKKEAWILRLCEAIKLPASKALVGDLINLPKETIERHARRLALAHKATKPKSGYPGQLQESKIPAGSELSNWLLN